MDVPGLLSALADSGFGDESTTRKVAVIQDVIWDIESRSPWPFLEAAIDLNFDGTSPIPTNFPSTFRAALRMTDLAQTGRRIRPIRLDDSEDLILGQYTNSGDPIVYYMEGGQLKVWPIPPAGTARLRLRYLQHSAAINSGSAESAILIPKTHHNAILYGALVQMYDMEDDNDIAVRYEQRFEARLAKMMEDLWKQQYDQNDYVHVIDPDDFDYDYL